MFPFECEPKEINIFSTCTLYKMERIHAIGLLLFVVAACMPYLGESVSIATSCTDTLTIECASGSILVHDAYRRDGKNCSAPSGVFTHDDPLVASAWLDCNLRKKCQIVDKSNRPGFYFAVHYDCVHDTALSNSVIDICASRDINVKEGYIINPGFPSRNCLNPNETPCSCKASPRNLSLDPVTVHARLTPTDVLDFTIDSELDSFNVSRNYKRSIEIPQSFLEAEFRTTWAGSWGGAFVIHYKAAAAFQLVCGRTHVAGSTCPTTPVATTTVAVTTTTTPTSTTTTKQTTTITTTATPTTTRPTSTTITTPPTTTTPITSTTQTTTTTTTPLTTTTRSSTIKTTSKQSLPSTTASKKPPIPAVMTSDKTLGSDGAVVRTTGTPTRVPYRTWEGLALSETTILITTLVVIPIGILILILLIAGLIIYCKRKKKRPRRLKSYWIPDIKRPMDDGSHLQRSSHVEKELDNLAMDPFETVWRQDHWDEMHRGPRRDDIIYGDRVESPRVAHGDQSGVDQIRYEGREELYTSIDFRKKHQAQRF